jgi:AraC-like DNA-binding protein
MKTSERVEKAALDLLPYRKPRVPKIAREIGMSEKTMYRRLRDEENTHFLRLYAAMRLRLAKALFHDDPNLSCTEVAWRVGFEESTSFTHFCKQHTGRTPRQLRAQYRKETTMGARYQWADPFKLTLLVVEEDGNYAMLDRGTDAFQEIVDSDVEIEPYEDDGNDTA